MKSNIILNKKQENACNQTEGPCMVIAGPGTGKTQVLSSRIENIIKNRPVDSSNILCLTFTENGALNMRKRLFSMIGQEAYKIGIFTFHSFCNKIIQENKDLFGNHDLDLISDIEKCEFLEKEISQLNTENIFYQKPGNYSYLIGILGKFFSEIKQENWQVEEIKNECSNIEENFHKNEKNFYQKNYKNFKKGDIKPASLKKNKEKIEKTLEAVKIFEKYQKFLSENGKYEFSDMIHWILKAFKENEDLLAEYQEQFLYILVDEYQDTNGSQNEIVNFLTQSSENSPNIFVVGDDDQSIYKFQGANIENMFSFYEKHKEKISLTVLLENYRSSKAIVETAKTSISQNTQRLVSKIEGLTKNIISAKEKSEEKVKIKVYENSFEEEIGVCEEIIKIQKNGGKLSEIAVIYDRHQKAENIIQYLKEKNIPINLKEKVNILNEKFIQNFIELLKYISGEKKSPFSMEKKLFKILHFEYFENFSTDLALLLFTLNKAKQDKESEEEILKLRLEIFEKEKLLENKSLKKPENIFLSSEKLNILISELENKNLFQFLNILIKKLNIYKYLIKSKNKIFEIKLLETFLDFSKKQIERNKDLNLEEFLEIIEKMKKYSLKIPVIFSNNSKGVNFLSCHSSKGLEFETVLFIGVGEKWENSKNKQPFIIPSKVELEKNDDFESFDLQEKRRLFYTSLTRAKKNLQISFPNKKEDGKEMGTCRFIDEILNKKESLDLIKIGNLDNDLIEEYTSLIFSNFQQKKENILNENLIKEKLEDYKLSFSDFKNYLNCPVNFYFEKIIKPASEQNGNFALGNVVHFTLDIFYKKSLLAGKILSKKYFLEIFDKKIIEDKNTFPKNNFEEMKKFGEKIMTNYFQKNMEEGRIIRKNEYKTEFGIECFFGQTPIKGRIDKINFDEKNENLVELIDFKTSKIDKKQLKPFENDENYGGDLWLQIAFYKLLVENYAHKKLEFNLGIIDSIRDNETAKISIQEENFELFKEKIQEVYEKIKNAEFNKGCGDLRCYGCEILREINSV